VKKYIEKHIPEKIDGPINENTPIQVQGLSEETRNLRPDLWFIRQYRHEKVLEILEFNCPYGRLVGEISTLKQCYKHKKQKYQRLADEFTRETGIVARVHPIIVSSLGAVYPKSMKNLHAILKCKDKALNNLGVWMSEQALMGSFKLWIQYHKSNDIRHADDTTVATEINLANQENIEDIEDEEESENEEERRTEENTEETETRSPTTVETEVVEIEIRDREETIAPVTPESVAETLINEIEELNSLRTLKEALPQADL
jgi:anthranilate/para-aminobenzoate synthase component II